LNALADELGRDVSPELYGPDGSRLSLGRAQRSALVQMLSKPSATARVRLPGGREISVDPATKRIRVEG
jgi:hypothetical protein